MLFSVLPFGFGQRFVLQEHIGPETFGDWTQRLSQRKIGQVEAMDEGNIGFILATNWQTRGVGTTKSRTNLQRLFGVAFKTDWCGSIADHFLPVAWYWNEAGWSRRLRDCGSRHRCSSGRSVGLHFSVIFQEVDTSHLAFVTGTFTLSPTGGVALVIPAIFSGVAPDSEEPIEDLFVFRKSVPLVIFSATSRSFFFNGRIVAPTDGNRMV